MPKHKATLIGKANSDLQFISIYDFSLQFISIYDFSVIYFGENKQLLGKRKVAYEHRLRGKTWRKMDIGF